ncbi:MAG: site-specific integrase [Bacteroidales bacterium]|nr:site-specific integrase [Bacteroidales bacterium]
MAKEDDKIVKEPVKIRFRELKNGNTSIYLDIYVNGVREYEFLNIYLRPEKERADRLWNKEQLRLANAVKAERIVSIQNGEFGFKDIKRARKLNFITYLESMAETYEANGQTACGVLTRSAIRRLVDYKGKVVPFSTVTKEYLIGFIDYLNNERYDFDKKENKKEGKPRRLSGVYKEALFARVMVALNKAEREGIILKNPGKSIDASLKPRAEEKSRAYLTLEEVKKISETEYRPKNDVKPAFMFACFTGLRYSDIYKLTWGEMSIGPDGKLRLDTKMKKTGKDLYLPLSDNAIAWLPDRENAPDNARVFYRLPDQVGNADARLHTLIRNAGIKKPVSFHVARHTFATLTLTYGADLYTVSKLLGHANMRTTQIYAKIVDENKRKAVNLIPNL